MVTLQEGAPSKVHYDLSVMARSWSQMLTESELGSIRKRMNNCSNKTQVDREQIDQNHWLVLIGDLAHSKF